MSGITRHQLRYASLVWCYAHAHVRRHGMNARRVTQYGVDGTPASEVKDWLIDIFEQCGFGLPDAEDEQPADDEICELWHYIADNWSLNDHDDLVERLMVLGLVVEHRTVDRHDHEFLKAAAKVRDAEDKQQDFDQVIDAVMREETEGAGAW